MDAGIFWNRALVALLVCVSLFASEGVAQSANLLPPGDLPEGPFTGFASSVSRKGQVLVKLQPSAFRIARDSLRRRHRIEAPSSHILLREIARLFGLRTGSQISGASFLLSGASVNNAKLQKLKRRGLVSRVEPNYRVNAFAEPNDFLYRLGFLWGIKNTGVLGGVSGVDIDALAAWEISVGNPDLVVAVVDTGVYLNHPDLVSNIWRNPGEIANNGIDDDKNGFVDDVNGWDIVDNDSNPNDEMFHGTHCAGIIAASLDNNRGLCGVAPRVKLLPLRVLNAKGEGDTVGLLKAVRYAIDLRKRGENIRVISASLGGGEYLESFKELLDEANRYGIVFVAAAGNDGKNNDEEPTYPANYPSPNVISVAALDSSGRLASFSNYGEKTVDVGAPGVFIWSSFLFGFYLPFDGTSMAAPFVSGAAALVLSERPQLTPAQVISILKRSSKPLPDLQGKLATPGIISAARALSTR
jgi:subtilisin family serine protease